MKAAREHARFGVEPPRYTPADRLEALSVVAQRARVMLAAPDDDAWMLATDELAAAVERLDEIERYLGIVPSAGAAA